MKAYLKFCDLLVKGVEYLTGVLLGGFFKLCVNLLSGVE